MVSPPFSPPTAASLTLASLATTVNHYATTVSYARNASSLIPLDAQRYGTLSERIQTRISSGEGTYMTKDDVLTAVEWKL
jgi:hypothetical protein